MLKKLLALGIMVLAIFAVFVFTRTNKTEPETQEITTNQIPSPAEENPTPNQASTGVYAASWIILRDPDKISLYSNLPEKLTTQEVVDRHLCDSLISGGFYSQEDKHLGLFVSEGQTINNSVQSNLFNGYFWIDKLGEFSVSSQAPNTENVRLAVQSGPMLITNGRPNKVVSETNENARRIVVAKTKKGEIAFVTLYTKNSNLIGPTLSELPKILDDIQKTKNLKFEYALNLDGGSHSAYITKNQKLAEVSKIGSYFCIQP